MTLWRQTTSLLAPAALMLFILLRTECLLAAEVEAPAPPVAATDSLATPSAPASASDSAVMPLAETGDETYASLVARLVGGLAVVVLLAWGGVFLLRRFGLGQPPGAPNSPIRLGQRVYLGPKKLICLVEIGDRTLALGVTEGSITALAEWRAGELELRGEDHPAAGFAGQLRALLGQRPPAAGRREGGQG